MPREYNIAWTENQRRRLNSAVRRYNNAIRRAAKANPLAADLLPKEVSYKELKSSIGTRRALNNTVNRLVRATRPDALEFVRQEDGSLVTRYERREFNILKSVRERKKSTRAKRLGVEQPKKGRIGSLAQASLSRDPRKASSLSASSLRRFIKTQERVMNRSSTEAARRYFQNYMAALRTVFGGFADYDEVIELIQDTIMYLAEENPDRMIDAIDTAPSIEYIYDPILRDAKMQVISEYWSAL